MSRTEPSSGSGSQSLFGDITSLFSLVLFLVFVTCALFTVTIGSRVYAGIQEKNDRIFYEDTSVSYIKNKIRQADRAGQISVREMEGTSVLCITDLENSYEDVTYETFIYTRDGWLMELFTSSDSGLTLGDGIPVMECSQAEFEIRTPDAGRPDLRLLQLTLGGSSSVIPLMSTGEGGLP